MLFLYLCSTSYQCRKIICNSSKNWTILSTPLYSLPLKYCNMHDHANKEHSNVKLKNTTTLPNLRAFRQHYQSTSKGMRACSTKLSLVVTRELILILRKIHSSWQIKNYKCNVLRTKNPKFSRNCELVRSFF